MCLEKHRPAHVDRPVEILQPQWHIHSAQPHKAQSHTLTLAILKYCSFMHFQSFYWGHQNMRSLKTD